MKRTVLVLAAATALVWTASAAAKECKPISGSFEATTVPCPAPLCTAGMLTGSLTSSYAFTMTSAVQEGPLLTFTGASTIVNTFGGAELSGADTGWIDFATGRFETTVNFVGGTKQYEGASGQLVATGNLTPTGTVGTYTGELCKHSE